MTKEIIRDYSQGNRIVGYITIKDDGDKEAQLVSGYIVGYYDFKRNVTLDTGKRILGNGDFLTSLIYNNLNK